MYLYFNSRLDVEDAIESMHRLANLQGYVTERNLLELFWFYSWSDFDYYFSKGSNTIGWFREDLFTIYYERTISYNYALILPDPKPLNIIKKEKLTYDG